MNFNNKFGSEAEVGNKNMVKAQSPKPPTAVSCIPTESSDVLHKFCRSSITISRREEEDATVVSQLIENLRSVVPTISHIQKEKVTDLEIMQHAINYIYHLNSVLSTRCTEYQHEQSQENEQILDTSSNNNNSNVLEQDPIIPSSHVSSTPKVPATTCQPLSAQVC